MATFVDFHTKEHILRTMSLNEQTGTVERAMEDQEGRRSATAVIASEAGWREVDLPVLWQRRSRSVVQEETGRAMPHLL